MTHTKHILDCLYIVFPENPKYSGWTSSTPRALALRSFLNTSVMDWSIPASSAFASSIEGAQQCQPLNILSTILTTITGDSNGRQLWPLPEWFVKITLRRTEILFPQPSWTSPRPEILLSQLPVIHTADTCQQLWESYETAGLNRTLSSAQWHPLCPMTITRLKNCHLDRCLRQFSWEWKRKTWTLYSTDFYESLGVIIITLADL